jgi:transposase InsO family protein
MDTHSKQERKYRHQAIRLLLQGHRPCEILQQIPRSRRWLYKWQRRFDQGGWESLAGRSRRPTTTPQAYAPQARAVVVRVRRSLQHRLVGLVGARAIQHEVRTQGLLHPLPSLATLKRWLKQAGLSHPALPPPPTVHYPAPQASDDLVLHAMDWTARYLEGGTKVFVFHTIDAQTQAMAQTLSTDKSGASLHRHVQQVWRTLGWPHGLLLDNDSAATGGERTPRGFGSFLRLCLSVGIELIFIPPGEPKRNGLVENLHHVWARSFWNRDHFGSFAEVCRKSSRFRHWYMHEYSPPALEGHTPAQAHRRVRHQRLTTAQLNLLPAPLPLTAGRLHFIRRVAPDGTIRVLGETWTVGRRLAHHYVWATIITHRQRLEIHHQRSAQSQLRFVKAFSYPLSEPVHPLRPEYHR